MNPEISGDIGDALPKGKWQLFRYLIFCLIIMINRLLCIIYRICPNRSAVGERYGLGMLGVHLLIQQKSLSSGSYNTHIYGKQELRRPLFTRKWRFADVRQPNRPEHRSNLSVFGRSFDVLSGIW